MMMSEIDPVLSQYEWLVVVGSFAAFWFGFATGSNDVANAFGTSVGAKTLTLRQAVVVAAVFEFTGAMVLGRVSTSTIAGGIANLAVFQREPEILAYGMVCALTLSGTWNVFCSYLEFNASSTHSIIGSIIGFSLVYGGADAVIWQTPDPASFPPYKGVVPIVVSWFFSPLFTAIAAAALFFLIRTLVLRRQNSYQLSFWVLPLFVLITFFICLYFVFTKGAAKTIRSENSDWTDAKSCWVSAVCAAGVALLVIVIVLPLLKRRADSKFNDDGTLKIEVEPAKDAEAQKEGVEVEGQEVEDPHMPKWKKMAVASYRKLKFLATHGTSVNIHELVEEDELVAAIHANAEVFDPKAEYVFQYLQVFSAICVTFAHGAGDVGYMAGPLATVWQMYTEGVVTKNVTAPAWVVLIGAFGLVVGLATYGYNVCRAMGVRLAKLTPTRGFCAELSTAFVIMICSQYGLPTSSSQCITGGIIGVGLLEGKMGVNWVFFAKQFSSWVATMFVCGAGTAALFAQGVYSPSKLCGDQLMMYEDQLSTLSTTMINNYRLSLLNYTQPANASLIPRLTTTQINSWNNTLTSVGKSSAAAATATIGTVDAQAVLNYLYQGLALYQYDTVLSVGQVNVYPGSNVCSGNTTAQVQANVTVPCLRPNFVPKALTNATWPPGVPSGTTTGRRQQ